jgi:hypothetical protein
MKTGSVNWIFVFVMASCGFVQEINKIDDHFFSDLRMEDRRVAAEMRLEVFGGNLDTLTYDYFVSYLERNEASSAKGLARAIKKADTHFFKTRKDAFLMLLYFKDARTIVGDNSWTSRLDTVIRLNDTDSIPSLAHIADHMRF